MTSKGRTATAGPAIASERRRIPGRSKATNRAARNSSTTCRARDGRSPSIERSLYFVVTLSYIPRRCEVFFEAGFFRQLIC